MRSAFLVAGLLLASSVAAASVSDRGEFRTLRPALASGSLVATASDGLVVAHPASGETVRVAGNGTMRVTTVTVHVVSTPVGEVAAEPVVDARDVPVRRGVSIHPAGSGAHVAARALSGAGVVSGIDRASGHPIAPSDEEFVFRFAREGRAGHVDRVEPGAYVQSADRATLSGPMRVFVTDARIVTDDGEEIETSSPPERSSGGVRDDRYVFAVLALHDGRLGLASVEAALVDPLVRVEGALDLANATGGFEAGGAPFAVRDDTVHLEGDLAVRFREDGGGPVPLLLFQVERTYEVDGSFVAFRLGNGPLVRLEPRVAVAVATAALVAFLAGLYTRLTRTHVTSAPIRRALLAEVARSPGIHLRALQRSCSLGWGGFTYHLSVLRRNGLVVLETRGRRVHVRLPGMHLPEEAPIASRGAARDVHAHLAEHGACTQRELRDALDLSPQLVSHHVRALERDGFVERLGGWPPRFAVAVHRSPPPRTGRAGP